MVHNDKHANLHHDLNIDLISIIYFKNIAIFHTSSGKEGIKAGVVLSVFYSRYRFLKNANKTS